MAVMKFTLDGEQYEFDNGKLMTSEAIEVKKLTGLTMQQWSEAMQSTDPEAFKVMVWLTLGRVDARPEGVKYSQFDFDLMAVLSSATSDIPEDAVADPTRAASNRASRRKSKPTGP